MALGLAYAQEVWDLSWMDPWKTAPLSLFALIAQSLHAIAQSASAAPE
jgi:hypothetical protein